MDVTVAILQGIWLIFPAYVAGPGAVLFGGGRSIDGGRMHKDGRRYLGDGKTWRGLVGGVSLGFIVGLLQDFANQFSEWPEMSFGSTSFLRWNKRNIATYTK